jgi:hypothetical protein
LHQSSNSRSPFSQLKHFQVTLKDISGLSIPCLFKDGSENLINEVIHPGQSPRPRYFQSTDAKKTRSPLIQRNKSLAGQYVHQLQRRGKQPNFPPAVTFITTGNLHLPSEKEAYLQMFLLSVTRQDAFRQSEFTVRMETIAGGSLPIATCLRAEAER